MQPLKTVNLMIVEDNPADSRLIVELLIESPCPPPVNPIILEDLQSAIAYLQTHMNADADTDRIDAVLLDLGLPDSDGLAGLERMTQEHGNLPIVVMTGRDEDHLGIESIRLGAQDYLPKSDLSGTVLSRAIQYAIERQRLMGALESQSAALSERDALLEEIINRNVDAIVVVDMDGIIRFANPAGEELFGRSIAELNGSEFGYPVVTGIATELDITRISKNGLQEERTIDMRAAQLRLINAKWGGKPSQIASLRDITVRKKMEEALRRSHVELEERVTQRTQDLQQINHALQLEIKRRRQEEQERRELESHLRHSQKMEAIGTLSGGIAHELNNLLMIVGGNAELLRESPGLTNQERGHIDLILKQTERGTQLTSHLLGYAKKGKYHLKRLDLNAQIAAMAAKQRAAQPGIGLNLELAENLVMIDGDAHQIKMALENVLKNAVEAMNGKGALTIATRNVGASGVPVQGACIDEGLYACIEIRDTGPGMDAILCERVFEPFYSTKPMHENAGLGLSSAYGITRNHNGQIDISSSLGKGTTVSFYFPQSRAAEAKDLPAADIPVDTPKRPLVLLVDTDVAVAEVIRIMLRSMGYAMVLSSSGPQAISSLEAHGHRIELIMMDINIPDLEGEKLIRQLRELAPTLPILIISSLPITYPLRRLLHVKHDGYLQKPFSKDELRQKIDMLKFSC